MTDISELPDIDELKDSFTDDSEEVEVPDDTLDEGNVLTPKESHILDKMRDLKLAAINSFTDHGRNLPTRSGDLRVLMEATSSVESSVTDRATLRLRGGQADAEQDLASVVADVLKAVATGNIPESGDIRTERQLELPDDAIDVEFVEGEMSLKPHGTQLKDIIGEEDDI